MLKIVLQLLVDYKRELHFIWYEIKEENDCQ